MDKNRSSHLHFINRALWSVSLFLKHAHSHTLKAELPLKAQASELKGAQYPFYVYINSTIFQWGQCVEYQKFYFCRLHCQESVHILCHMLLTIVRCPVSLSSLPWFCGLASLTSFFQNLRQLNGFFLCFSTEKLAVRDVMWICCYQNTWLKPNRSNLSLVYLSRKEKVHNSYTIKQGKGEMIL